jgi:hypothetical protein
MRQILKGVCQLGVGLFLLGTVACANTTIIRGGSIKSSPHVFRHNIAWLGLYEASEPVDTRRICEGNPWQGVVTHFSPVNVLVGFATLGFYTPKTVHVYCQSK